ncbi:MAG: MaoC family dehydratase N-terminal domain-containing protein [Rhodobacteraceae bacterium]|nr:MaoC family dehydratase N-terminal domain-containing protein [Paracoccaceae bacterium]
MQFSDLIGHDLGKHRVTYSSETAILYALSVGAAPDALDLTYERDLRVLPSFGTALGLWAVEKAGDLGAYDRKMSLHASQELQVHKALPRQGDFEMTGRVAGVWDKGRATMVDIVAECEYFSASYGIFLPGRGGWGGERGPASASAEVEAADWSESYATWANQAAIYRLTGDMHPIHIDPKVARANGFERPILHGLCTLGIAARAVAGAAGAHPCDLINLSARLAAPVLPGEVVVMSASRQSDQVIFNAATDKATVLKGGVAKFR